MYRIVYMFVYNSTLRIRVTTRAIISTRTHTHTHSHIHTHTHPHPHTHTHTAIGCADLDSDDEMTVTRSENKAMITCRRKHVKWHVTCRGDTWLGASKHNCSAPGSSSGYPARRGMINSLCFLLYIFYFSFLFCSSVFHVSLYVLTRYP